MTEHIIISNTIKDPQPLQSGNGERCFEIQMGLRNISNTIINLTHTKKE
jgi:hypothetical protein